jgi:hypothetical protein
MIFIIAKWNEEFVNSNVNDGEFILCKKKLCTELNSYICLRITWRFKRECRKLPYLILQKRLLFLTVVFFVELNKEENAK